MIEDTGERVIPKKMSPMNNLLLEDIARYQFALPYLEGRVLDMACGAGYGTHMIAKQRKKFIDEVIGIDIDPEIIVMQKRSITIRSHRSIFTMLPNQRCQTSLAHLMRLSALKRSSILLRKKTF